MPIQQVLQHTDTFLSVSRDITVSKQWEQHQQLLINELNHRVKNTLATVQSIASQTAPQYRDGYGAKPAIEGRLLCLSRPAVHRQRLRRILVCVTRRNTRDSSSAAYGLCRSSNPCRFSSARTWL